MRWRGNWAAVVPRAIESRMTITTLMDALKRQLATNGVVPTTRAGMLAVYDSFATYYGQSYHEDEVFWEQLMEDLHDAVGLEDEDEDECATRIELKLIELILGRFPEFRG